MIPWVCIGFLARVSAVLGRFESLMFRALLLLGGGGSPGVSAFSAILDTVLRVLRAISSGFGIFADFGGSLVGLTGYFWRIS